MRRFLWVLVILGSLAGGLVLVATMTFAQGAPQEAAGAALAVALAVLPYCLARAGDSFAQMNAEDARAAKAAPPMPVVEGGKSIPVPKDWNV